MKEIINAPTNSISVDEIDFSKPIATYNKFSSGSIDKCVLIQEDKGYIFKNINGQGGHSGHNATQKQAIYRALSVSNTQIFQFDSYRELADWILNK